MLSEFRSTNITWDKATSRIYSPVTANESDENGRKLVVQIVNGGKVEDLTGAALHLYWITIDKLHDGLDVFEAVDLKKGEFELSYTTGMLSNKGTLNANLVLVDTAGRIVSERFKITVKEGIDNDAIQSEDSFSSLTQALIDVGNLEQNYAPRLNDLTAQLTQKADKTQLESLSGGTPKLIVQDVSNLPSSVASGDERLALVLADGHKYYWSGSSWTDAGIYQAVEVADGTITPIKLNRGSVDTLSDNLYKPTDVIYKEYVGTSGEVIVAPTWTDRGRTPYYPVEAGATYIFNIMSAYKDISLFFYKFNNEDMVNKTKVNLMPTGNIDEYIVTVPEDRNFTRWTIGAGFIEKTYFRKVIKGNKFVLQWLEVDESNLSSNLADLIGGRENAPAPVPITNDDYSHSLSKPYIFQGKSGVWFGDSITYGMASTPDLHFTENGYAKLLSTELGLSYMNRAISGSVLADTTDSNSILNRILNYSTPRDFVFVAGGTNDHSLNKPLGTLGDTTGETVYGALYTICEHFKDTRPDSTIIFITPIAKTRDYPDQIAPLDSYRKAIYEMATIYGYDVIDGRQIGFPNKPGAFANALIEDGVHPSELGHQHYAKTLRGILA